MQYMAGKIKSQTRAAAVSNGQPSTLTAAFLVTKHRVAVLLFLWQLSSTGVIFHFLSYTSSLARSLLHPQWNLYEKKRRPHGNVCGGRVSFSPPRRTRPALLFRVKGICYITERVRGEFHNFKRTSGGCSRKWFIILAAK